MHGSNIIRTFSMWRTHTLEFVKMLENGGLAVKMTTKVFARTPVDLTLEQTSNADAASRLTGIAAFSQSVGTRKR